MLFVLLTKLNYLQIFNKIQRYTPFTSPYKELNCFSKTKRLYSLLLVTDDELLQTANHKFSLWKKRQPE